MAEENHHIGKYIGETLLFSTYLEEDNRTPFVTFPFPTFIASSFGQDANAKLGIVMASLEFWIALVVVMLIGSIFNIFVAVLSYRFIVLPRRCQDRRNYKKDGQDTANDHRTGSMTPYLFGFGVIMPLASMYPYLCIPLFGVKNKMLKFFFGVQSLTTFFRCSEGTFILRFLMLDVACCG